MKAYEVFKGFGWTKGAYARDHTDSPVEIGDKEAVSYCTVGAIFLVYGNLYGIQYLKRLIVDQNIENTVSSWNDKVGQTKENVIETLKKLDI